MFNPPLPDHAVNARWRSEEHTSELQSQSNLVCRLLLEKTKEEVHRARGVALEFLENRRALLGIGLGALLVDEAVGYGVALAVGADVAYALLAAAPPALH